MVRTLVQSLVGELGSHKSVALGKGKKKKYFRGIKEVFCYEHQSKTTFQEGGYLGIPWQFSR